MTVTRETILDALRVLKLPDGEDVVAKDMVRALTIDGDTVRFVIEAAPEIAKHLEPLRAAAQQIVERMDGVTTASVLLTAHSDKKPPSLKVGKHPEPQAGPSKPKGVARILAVASGKGGVGKSTLSSNLAVALAKQGRRVGLLDADIYGPSQPRMMGVSKRPASPDGKTIIPLKAHGVTMMSIGLMMDPDKAIVWRGPMLMGALQQMLGQVEWGELDVLIVDLPPGTGDVQLTLCTKSELSGAIVVSTPQDVALLDAKKAIDMFNTLKTPVLGLVENMSMYICPTCGTEAHIFGHGGVKDEAAKMGLPFLGEIPLDIDVRLSGDSGTPIAAGDGPVAQAYAKLAEGLVKGGMA
ncbi:Mrp/NBP35 family ATP-binding protein [Litoreibacter albidus]|uniref:Iron-sulfur cluster carrier protein n=1 Tax=Litoreibacter albidus TaxID=670155 RepID=A0A1H3B5M2_9RHOB|nr:Mrp/NBP35 family ATP-binding protein [Litoreibacter albidus]SDX36931.1 ATP-binding protein involved in chromosome partitioning [Litoreibacter albidus]